MSHSSSPSSFPSPSSAAAGGTPPQAPWPPLRPLRAASARPCAAPPRARGSPGPLAARAPRLRRRSATAGPDRRAAARAPALPPPVAPQVPRAVVPALRAPLPRFAGRPGHGPLHRTAARSLPAETAAAAKPGCCRGHGARASGEQSRGGAPPFFSLEPLPGGARESVIEGGIKGILVCFLYCVSQLKFLNCKTIHRKIL